MNPDEVHGAPIVPMDKLAKAYVKIRDAKGEVQKEYDAKIAELDAAKDEIANALKTEMQKLGVDSMRTQGGTVMLQRKTRYFTNDWDAMKQFVVEHGVVDLLEKRIAQKNMAQWLQENPKLVPPGLNSDSEFEISVRRV
jgi:hypothetical protein